MDLDVIIFLFNFRNTFSTFFIYKDMKYWLPFIGTLMIAVFRMDTVPADSTEWPFFWPRV